ncbi:hypothetical protein ACVWU4_000868 [Campylobacter coli]
MALETKNFEVTKVEGVAKASYRDENAYKDNVGVEFSVIKQVEEGNQAYIEQCVEVAVDKAIEEFKADKDLQTFNASFPFSTSKRGEVNVLTNRCKEYTNLKDGSKILTATVQTAVKAPFMKPKTSLLKEKKDELNKTLGN